MRNHVIIVLKVHVEDEHGIVFITSTNGVAVSLGNGLSVMKGLHAILLIYENVHIQYISDTKKTCSDNIYPNIQYLTRTQAVTSSDVTTTQLILYIRL